MNTLAFEGDARPTVLHCRPMQATRILAIRHGETTWNVDTRIQGQLDIGLNDTGHWQASRLGQALAEESIDAIYSSDLQRAFATAQAIGAACDVTVTPEPQLRERHFGHLQGQTWAEIETHWPEQARLWRGRDPHWQPEGVNRWWCCASASRHA